MKIGITGGAGFIGGHVADYCLANGHTPIIFDRRGRRHDVGDGTYIETFLGDVTKERDVSELAKHVDGIIHLAAVLGTQETVKNPIPSAETNTLGSLNVWKAAVECDIEAVYIEVGNYTEENTYSISKTAAGHFASMFNRFNGARINRVRAVNAYGPRQSVAPPFGPAKVRKITPSFVCRALTGMPIEIYGDGEQVSDMVYVGDVAKALVMALEAAKEGNVLADPVGVGPYETDSMTVNAFANLVRLKVASLGGPMQPGLKHLPMRPGETPGSRVSVDPDTLKQIGFNPADLVPLQVGLDETVKWFRDNWLAGFQRFDDDLEADDTVVSG